MMRKMMLLSAAVLVLLSACHKKDDPKPSNPTTPTNTTGTMGFSFANKVGNQPVVLHTGVYQNANGDTYSINLYKYYISNIKLTSDNGTVFAEPNSYHLVNEELTSSKTFSISNVPSGNYTSVTFLIGVDSAANTSGANTGALDPQNGMYWAWNSGYIMAKLEGTSPQSTAPNNAITFHMGGFAGKNNVLKTVTLQLPTAATVSAAKTPVINLNSDAAQWFGTPNVINFAQLNTVTDAGLDAASISQNYKNMFSIDHVDNQ
ncbi:MbnP family protein [Taibaiella soli]|uniref:Copper-binding protein MbnP-like domain-containing protein n=1 Tax=Taibaiella soli TaxID=1649169 RepID=A0A2W2BHR8_9BACT|nr:MbnP family protein [Taibaiella soli]PZF73046.1 hypothetical protein DN068_09235 [Taibaiella soli]